MPLWSYWVSLSLFVVVLCVFVVLLCLFVVLFNLFMAVLSPRASRMYISCSTFVSLWWFCVSMWYSYLLVVVLSLLVVLRCSHCVSLSGTFDSLYGSFFFLFSLDCLVFFWGFNDTLVWLLCVSASVSLCSVCLTFRKKCSHAPQTDVLAQDLLTAWALGLVPCKPSQAHDLDLCNIIILQIMPPK